MTASILIAAYYKRKITETLPVAVLLSIFMFFLLGLTGRISHIVGAYLLCIVAADIVFFYLHIRDHSLSRIRECFDPGIVIWLVLVILLIPIYHHYQVFNWDDYHYWAIYPRNMFAVNGAPNGSFACTDYKDYMRGIQFVYFFVFKIIGRYSESAMFIVNNALIVTMLMPFFEKGTGHAIDRSGIMRYVLKVSVGIMMPYLCMFQMIHCLGVDCIMTVMFGYGLWSVYDKNRDAVYYVRLMAVMAALTVTKAAGLTFAAVILVVFLIKKRKKLLPLICFIPSAAAFVLWKIYCNSKGNSTYLHDIFEKNVTGRNAFAIPDYAGDVTGDFVRSFFTFRLNGGPIGFTPFVILCLAVAVYILGAGERTKEDRRVFIALIAGMILYLLSVLYTYLFVFVRWEAESLSSYDRYVSNYLGAMLYLLAIILYEKTDMATVKLAVVAAICALTLNYGFIVTHFVPSMYAQNYADEIAKRSETEKMMKNLTEAGLPEGERVAVVIPEPDDELALYIRYYAVPQNAGTVDAATLGGSLDTLIEKTSGDGISYIYFSEESAGLFGGERDPGIYRIENGALSHI